MRNKLFALLLFYPYLSFCQTGTAKESRAAIELAAYKKGVLLRKEYTKLAEVRGISFSHMKVEDLSTKVKYTGVEVNYGGNTGFIDSDEVKTLIKALELVRDNRLDPKPGISYEFMCKGGFNMSFFWLDDKWVMIMGIGDKYKEKSSYTVETVDILRLVKIMNDASLII